MADNSYPLGGRIAVEGSQPTAEQMQTIRAFRDTILRAEEYRAHEAEARVYVDDDRLLHRFLSARKYDMGKAVDMMRKHLVWRFGVYRPFEIRCEEMQPYARTGCVQVSPHGLDRWGRPVIILDDSKDCIKEPDAKKKQHAAMRHLAFSLERASRQMLDGVEKNVVFISLEDFSLWTAPNLATTRETIDMVCNQFPERLGHCIMYKAPLVFTSFWKVAQRFLDPSTAAKVTFISGDVSEGSENDRRLISILGANWRELTRQDEPIYEEGGSRGHRHVEAWKKACHEETVWLQRQGKDR